ncbi:TldD/PmbA family protein [Tissierella sp. MSJ-40]|uniref:TldD/PmbA family protein n=1 Tax=Tissierella simiarum TaxID=2841534 RepID=A0ABS6E5E9_9FIRM|nr:TldD/PmbA family protein [Tissierella simiarum]MBU5438135.1 TldD/PmbA family protein [Tissierella simiarum]
MFKFPDHLYTDVRIEDVYETEIVYSTGEIEESKIRNYKAAFIRVFDGEMWYYSSISNLESIQKEIDSLSSYASPNREIDNHPIVNKLQVTKEKLLKFEDNGMEKIEIKRKHDLLKEHFPLLEGSTFIKNWKAAYVDRKVNKEFYSSKGSEVIFDTQSTGIFISMQFGYEEKMFSENYQISYDNFDSLDGKLENFKSFIKQCEDFLLESQPVKPGKYTVILSPSSAGVFAHESFGHKSEADFMIGDEAMKKEWAIGKKVGSDILSIVDSGNISGSGYTPFDDEGIRAEKTYLIKNGILSGRLHSGATAASLEENLTGNARAVDFEFEPIVRMTTTYIEPGNKTKDELFSEVKEGIYVETIKHGSGMSTFTLAPSLAYYIKDGKIANAVNISVITGNVMETLKEIDGLSDKLEILSFVIGGCGKMEQAPLPVGFGGPYVRVNNLNVQ